MNDKERKLLERIAIDPRVMAGKPVIRGSRLTVQFILGLLGHGMSIEEVLDEYEGLGMTFLPASSLPRVRT